MDFPMDFQMDFQKDFQMTFKRPFKWIFKWMFERFSNICEKQFKNMLFSKKALQHKTFLGQNTARPSFLNVFFRQKVISLQFHSGG